MKILAVTFSSLSEKETCCCQTLEKRRSYAHYCSINKKRRGEKNQNFLFVFPFTDENVYEDLPELCLNA